MRSNPYEEYAAAMAAEKAAWEAVKDRLPGTPRYDLALWENWRQSIARADRTRRLLAEATPSFGVRLRDDGPHNRSWASARLGRGKPKD